MNARALSALPCALVLFLAATTAACSGGESTKAAEPAIAETPDAYRDQATKLRREGKFKEAMDAALKAYTLAGSGNPRVLERLELAKINGASGNADGAINEIKSLEDEKRAKPPTAIVDEVDIAEVYAQIGDPNAVFRWLPRAVEAKSPKLQGIEANPDLEPVKADPRWQQFLATIPK